MTFPYVLNLILPRGSGSGQRIFNSGSIEFRDSVANLKYDLPVTVAVITLVEGLAIYINMVIHPNLQPGITAFIIILAVTLSAFVVWYGTTARCFS